MKGLSTMIKCEEVFRLTLSRTECCGSVFELNKDYKHLY